MRTSSTYIDAIRAKLGLKSDAAVARALGVGRQSIAHYRHGISSMDDEVCAKAAAILEIHPGTVLLDMYAERTRNPAIKHVWHEVAAAFLFMAPPAPAQQMALL